MSRPSRTPQGLGPWSNSFNVGMKAPPSSYQSYSFRDPVEQALLDMAVRAEETPVYPYEHFDKLARREARRATIKAAAALGALYLGALATFVAFGTDVKEVGAPRATARQAFDTCVGHCLNEAMQCLDNHGKREGILEYCYLKEKIYSCISVCRRSYWVRVRNEGASG